MNQFSEDGVRFIDCTEQEHAVDILDIFNESILQSTALYEYVPRTLETMHVWFATKQVHGFPVIGALNRSGQFLGFATWGVFRAYPAYKYTVEHSVYVHRSARGMGIGKRLMRELIQRARQAQLHVLVGCIDADNAASIHLHQQMGFRHSGTFSQVGFKFGRWLDVVFYQLNLDTPQYPVDG